MTVLSAFLPLYSETADAIRGRLNTDVNAGLQGDDPRWVDTREGSFFYDLTQPVLMELARLWDALAVEVPAAAFPLFAWGVYLDYHGAVFGLTRKDAVQASGWVTFSGDAAIYVPTGTIVATEPPGGGDAVEFATTLDGTTGTALAPPANVVATPSATGGTLVADTYYYWVTSFNDFGETDAIEVEVTVTGSTAKVVVTWSAVSAAEGYRVYRGDILGGAGAMVYESLLVNVLTFTDTGVAGTLEGPPDENSTAGVSLLVQALAAGAAGNVGGGSITSLETPVDGIDVVTNPVATTLGEEAENDERFRERVLLEYLGSGAGNINDYRRWALAEDGVGEAYVEPNWRGPGTVHVVIMGFNGNVASSATVAALQALLDPVSGEGAGVAPVGASVTVSTPVLVTINPSATVVFKDGYNLDGSGGQVGVRAAIEDAVRDYVDGLDVGDDVVYQNVLAQFFRAVGVYSVTGLTVNGGTANIAIGSDPPQTAQVGTITLS